MTWGGVGWGNTQQPITDISSPTSSRSPIKGIKVYNTTHTNDLIDYRVQMAHIPSSWTLSTRGNVTTTTTAASLNLGSFETLTLWISFLYALCLWKVGMLVSPNYLVRAIVTHAISSATHTMCMWLDWHTHTLLHDHVHITEGKKGTLPLFI